MKIKINNVEIYYEVHGEGQPMLLVHGNGESHKIFDQAVKVLSKKYKCYIVDSRGHGQSTNVKEFHYQDMADDMTTFMEILDLREVIFYGFSDGGIIGLLTAMQSDRLAHLIVSGANIHPYGVSEKLYKSMRFVNRFKRDPKVTLMLTEPMISKSMLEKIKVPTLVLAGEHDVILEEHTKKMASMIPNSRCQILKGEGHGSYIVHKKRIATLILTYLKFMQEKDDQDYDR